MQKIKLLGLLLLSAVIIYSCKKEDSTVATTPGNSDTDNCQQRLTAESVDGHYIVTLKAGVANKTSTPGGIVEIGGLVLSKNKISASALLQSFAGDHGGFVARLSKLEAEALKNDPDVAIVEPDRIIKLGSCFTVAEPRLVTWNISRVGYGDGTGLTAWVIDTGIDFDHPDLTVDIARSRSFLSDDASADDQNGHGTHVAGIIGAKNNSIGVLGVASGATLVSLRVLNKDGEGLLSSIVQALAYVNTNAKAGDVVNMSIGDDAGISASLDQQVQNTAAKGIFIAIAAGNDHDEANKYSPGRANGTNIYTVSAIDSLDNVASFSNYGSDVVDYACPGVRILSTYMGGKYAYMSGTSMASPHMAGLLLLRGKSITTSGYAKNDPDNTPDPIAHY